MPVLAYHLVFTAYGWWLPNDPRGSASRSIRSDVIAVLGDLHHGRKSVQPAGWEIRKFYEEASGVLKHELLLLDARGTNCVGGGFRDVIRKRQYTCYACAIMPDHVHALIRKHRDKAEQMITNLQEESRRALTRASQREADHPVWGGPGWKVYLNTPDDIRRTIRYIEENPIPFRLPNQQWDFVRAYDGWNLDRAAR